MMNEMSTARRRPTGKPTAIATKMKYPRHHVTLIYFLVPCIFSILHNDNCYHQYLSYFCDGASSLTPLHQKKRKKKHFNARSNDNKMSMANVTCFNFTQPFDHFSPGSNNQTFEQRYCIHDTCDNRQDTIRTNTHGEKHYCNNGNSSSNDTPIFFYTGNESPIDEYVNNTGLIWELAPKFSALVVFAEHRFEGTSVPDDYDSLMAFSGNGNGNGAGCFTYLTTTQTLADYASLLSHLNPYHKRPVVTFGGSYGGMLSAWMKILYGSIVAGSIASSAPVWGLPKTMIPNLAGTSSTDVDDEMVMDRASYVVGQALLQNNVNVTTSESYSNEKGSPTKSIDDTDEGGDKVHKDQQEPATHLCFQNLLATWPLIKYYGQSEKGRELLTNEFRLCTPVRNEMDVTALLNWAQSPWFDLAEGDYPYPSSYIPYALGQGLNDLPAWPLQEACYGSTTNSGLDSDFGISFVGNTSAVKYDIYFGHDSSAQENANLVLHIDWDNFSERNDNKTTTTLSHDSVSNEEPKAQDVASKLFSAVRKAVSVWFNITKTLDCFDAIPAVNDNGDENEDMSRRFDENVGNLHGTIKRRNDQILEKQKHVCQEKIDNETVWGPLVCNDNINLIMTYAKGIGRDFFWPPSHPQNKKKYQDTINNRTEVMDMYEIMCADPDGIFGYPDKSKVDPYSTFLDNIYGGRRVGHLRNIIFSNGMLDPWSAAGVYSSTSERKEPTEMDGDICRIEDKDNMLMSYDCRMVQNITKDGSVIALLLDLGAHHLDLMYSSDQDPICAKVARLIEEEHISKWIDEWNEGQQCPAS